MTITIGLDPLGSRRKDSRGYDLAVSDESGVIARYHTLPFKLVKLMEGQGYRVIEIKDTINFKMAK
jgi:hypothetical protein